MKLIELDPPDEDVIRLARLFLAEFLRQELAGHAALRRQIRRARRARTRKAQQLLRERRREGQALSRWARQGCACGRHGMRAANAWIALARWGDERPTIAWAVSGKR